MTDSNELDTAGDLGSATAGVLRISGGAANLTITGASLPGRLYHAHFRDLIPTVTDEDGTVTVRYQRRLHPFAVDKGEGTVELSAGVPWNMHVRDASAGLTATLTAITLAGLTFDSSVADVTLDLPRPVGEVTIRIDGPARNLRLRRPAGVPVGVRIDGGASHLQIDGQRLGAIGHGYQGTTPTEPDRYAVVITGAADGLVVSH